MKYEQKLVQFVRCNEIDERNKCEEETIDGCCSKCMESYETLTDDVINEWVSENPDRDLKDFMEVSNEHNPDFPRILTFGFWSMPSK
jgi:hypothetical protein